MFIFFLCRVKCISTIFYILFSLPTSIKIRKTKKNCVHSASVRCANLVTSLQLLVKSKVRSDPKKQASGVEITQTLRKNFTKELQNFRNFGAPRAQKSYFVGQHALRKPYDVTEAFDWVHRAFRFEKAGARRRDHANFVRKSREKIVKFRNYGAPCAERIAYTK